MANKKKHSGTKKTRTHIRNSSTLKASGSKKHSHSSGNREYKSDTFSLLMSIPEYALDTYNGLNNTNYKDPEAIIYKRLDRSFSLSMQNDASFIFNMELNLYGHQSSYSPNLPLRGLIYFTDIIRDYIKKRDLFSTHSVKIPTPRFVIFYNGPVTRPEVEVLKLSDSFEKQTDHPELELTCTVYNINQGYNTELLSRCQIIHEYMILIDTIRNLLDNEYTLERAIEEGINHCIENHILEEFLKTHRNEVAKVMKLDYTFEKRLEYAREEEYKLGLNEGLSRGHTQGLSEGLSLGHTQGLNEGLSEGLSALVSSLREFLTTPEEILTRVIQNPKYADVTLEQVKKYF